MQGSLKLVHPTAVLTTRLRSLDVPVVGGTRRHNTSSQLLTRLSIQNIKGRILRPWLSTLLPSRWILGSLGSSWTIRETRAMSKRDNPFQPKIYSTSEINHTLVCAQEVHSQSGLAICPRDKVPGFWSCCGGLEQNLQYDLVCVACMHFSGKIGKL